MSRFEERGGRRGEGEVELTSFSSAGSSPFLREDLFDIIGSRPRRIWREVGELFRRKKKVWFGREELGEKKEEF